jgi:DNA-binding NarL/FixJ family response regulator
MKTAQIEEESKVLKVLVIGPRLIYKESLTHYLSRFPEIEAISVSSAGEELNLTHRELDIILLCVGDSEPLPADLSEVTRGAEELRSLPVVVLSNNRPSSQVLNLLRAGVLGFIPSEAGCTVAVQGLLLVKAGCIFAPASCLSALLDKGTGAERNILFTGRQKQVIEALTRGKSNKTIAYELNMCEGTVKVHVRNIMKKLKASNRTEVAYIYSSSVKKVSEKD